MALTRDLNHTIRLRMQREPAFAKAMLNEAATLLLNGEPQPAWLILRDVVNATLGVEALSATIGRPAKSLHRMLSARGNPGMDSLSAIFSAVQSKLGAKAEVRCR